MTNYIMKCFIILASIAPFLCQYAVDNQMKPDVRFDDRNDRFDVSNLIRKQKHFRQENILDPQSEEYRRKGKRRADGKKKDKDTWFENSTERHARKKFRNELVNKIERQANEIANTMISRIKAMRRSEGDFAYHDTMISDEGGDEKDFSKNLESSDNVYNFMETLEDTRRMQNIVDNLHGKPTRRIIVDPKNEILLHYALPLDMKIEGFLQPLNNK